MGGVAPASSRRRSTRRGVRRPADGRRGRAHRGRRRDRRRRPRRPCLRDPADAAARERARADREARRGAGGGDREGQDARRAPAVGREHAAVGDAGAVPGHGRVRVAGASEGGQGRRLPADREAGAAAEADAAELPKPRQLRGLGRAARPLPGREGRGGGRLHPAETTADKLLVEDRIVVGVRTGDKGRDRDGEPLAELRARLGRDGEGDGARRGHARPPHARGDGLLRPARRGPAALGARREGGVGGPEAARPRDPHDGLAAAQGRALERVRRQLHLPDGRGQGLHRLRRRPRLHGRDLLRPRRAPAVQAPPVRAARSSTAASGSPGARRRSPPAATSRCRASSRCRACASPATRPGWSTSPS